MNQNPFDLPGGGLTERKMEKKTGLPPRPKGVMKARPATAPAPPINEDFLAGLFGQMGVKEAEGAKAAVPPQFRNLPSRAARTKQVERFVPRAEKKTTNDAQILNAAVEARSYMMRYENAPENTMEFDDARGVEYLRALYAADGVLRRKVAAMEKQLAKIKGDIADNRVFYEKYMGEIDPAMVPQEMPKKITTPAAMEMEGGKKRQRKRESKK